MREIKKLFSFFVLNALITYFSGSEMEADQCLLVCSSDVSYCGCGRPKSRSSDAIELDSIAEPKRLFARPQATLGSDARISRTESGVTSTLVRPSSAVPI